jgi:uncharacterized membrane-anchored protein
MRIRQPVIALAAVLVVVPSALADDKGVNWSRLRAVSRQGAFAIELKEKVTLRVPQGYRLVTEDKLKDYHDLMNDVALPDEAGVLLPERGGWMAIISFPKDDPLKGNDDKQLDSDALMKWNEKELEDVRSKRSALGLAALKITGWTHKPAYDEATKRLTMGMRVTDNGDQGTGKKDELYYKTLIYGPDGAFVCLQTTTAFGNWAEPVEETKKLASEFSYPQTTDTGAEDPMYYVKIGGAGALAVVVVIVLSKIAGGRKPQQSARPTARRFGTPR